MWKLKRSRKPAKARLGEHRVFIAARHGCHDPEHLSLTERGKNQMRELAAAVRRVATKRGLKVEILSSTEPCALRGARIIAEELGMYSTQVISHDCFLVDDKHTGDYNVAHKLVEALFREGVLLHLVSNVVMTHRVVRHIAWVVGIDGKREEVPHGKGLMIAKKGVSVIPRPH